MKCECKKFHFNGDSLYCLMCGGHKIEKCSKCKGDRTFSYRGAHFCPSCDKCKKCGMASFLFSCDNCGEERCGMCVHIDTNWRGDDHIALCTSTQDYSSDRKIINFYDDENREERKSCQKRRQNRQS